MTNEEALERAEKIISLGLPKELLVIEIGREFQRIAEECGWCKEVLRDCQEQLAWTKAVSTHLKTIMLAAIEQEEVKK